MNNSTQANNNATFKQSHDLLEENVRGTRRSPNPYSVSFRSRNSRQSSQAFSARFTKTFSNLFGSKQNQGPTVESDRNLPIHETISSNPKSSVDGSTVAGMTTVNIGQDISRGDSRQERRKLGTPCFICQALQCLALFALAALVLFQNLAAEDGESEAAFECPDGTKPRNLFEHDEARVLAAEEIDFSTCEGNFLELDDSDLVALIADNAQFLDLGEFGLGLVYQNFDVPCLPAKAFDGVIDQFPDEWQNIDTIVFQGNGLTKITEGAFVFSDPPGNVKNLFITDNGIGALPDKVFEPFVETPLTVINLSRNAIQTFDNNVFGALTDLERVNLNENTGLTRFPLAFFDMSQVNEILLNQCFSLINADKDSYEQSGASFGIIETGNNPLQVLFPDEPLLQQHLQIQANIRY